MWPQVLAITLRHVGKKEQGDVSFTICMSLCTVLILILFFKRYIIYFVSKLMYFCIMARNIWEANKEEAKQSQVLAPVGCTIHYYAVCAIVSLVIE